MVFAGTDLEKNMASRLLNKFLRFSITSNARVSLERRRIQEALMRSASPRSCIFFTTHKCASTFAARLLSEITQKSEYRVLDYASAIWRMGNKISIQGSYEPFLEGVYDGLYRLHGEIYGPQRMPLDFPGRPKFKHIFFLRDPRDVLVSSYFSFAFNHKAPNNSSAKSEFFAKRERMVKSGIDDYVLGEGVKWLKPTLLGYAKLLESAESPPLICQI